MTQDPHHPARPRRRRRLWIVVGLFLTLLLAIPLAWLIWNHASHRAFDRMVADYRARGEPILPADLTPAPIPDDQNAALPLRHAFEVIKAHDLPALVKDALQLGLPFTDEERAAIDLYIQQTASARDHLNAAQLRPAIAWDLQITSPMIGVLLPDLNGARATAQALQAAALRSHETGDDAQAIEAIEQMHFIADSLRDYPLMVSYILAQGIHSSAARTIVQIAVDLQIEGGSSAGGHAVDRVRVDALIQRLLNGDQHLRDAAKKAFASERVNAVDGLMVSAPAFRAELRPALYTLCRPAFRQEAVDVAQHIDSIIAAHAQPNWPAAAALLPKPPPDAMFPRSIARAATRALRPPINLPVERTYSLIADNRAAATALAIRLYAIDHDGAIPESLDQLVPDYLPTLPLDPMDPAGQPLRYRPDPDRPILYSVGPNGIDDGGQPPPLVIDRYAGRSTPPDLVYDLRPPRKQFAPPQPGDLE